MPLRAAKGTRCCAQGRNPMGSSGYGGVPARGRASALELLALQVPGGTRRDHGGSEMSRWGLATVCRQRMALEGGSRLHTEGRSDPACLLASSRRADLCSMYDWSTHSCPRLCGCSEKMSSPNCSVILSSFERTGDDEPDECGQSAPAPLGSRPLDVAWPRTDPQASPLQPGAPYGVAQGC